MAPLDPSLRGALEKAVVGAREEAEKAAEVALKTLAVDQPQPFATQATEQRRLRNALRARARQLGGGQKAGLRPLVEEVAYEQWHRMLFARFLAENNLLMHPTGVPVTLKDCAELAAEEGEPDQWQLAARYAGRMLPGIFRTDGPSVQVLLAPEGRAALEAILAEIPLPVFTSDDGLGWVYQFWQSKKKKEVSGSGRKIEGLDLAAYSQLFTEHYMVQFLLENSLGAWWASRHPDSPLVKEFTYLRFREDGTPAAGSFPGWPEHAAEVTTMDPCCGSGHFLVVAFQMLRRMRMEEEDLGPAEAADAVLRDNVYGLEIDARCVQIAAFALALAAWKVGGYRPLPLPNIACSGILVGSQSVEWTKLAGDDVNLRHSLERLYDLFRDALDLGSLVNPSDVPVRDRMFAPDFGKVGPLLERALAKERAVDDPVAAIFGEAAKSVARAAVLLARQYILVATNVPYLARGKQGERLKEFIEGNHPEAKADLATAFVERCRAFTMQDGTYALVTPQNWLFLSSYKHLRATLLRTDTLRVLVLLGEEAWQSFGVRGPRAILIVTERASPNSASVIAALDQSANPGKTQILIPEKLQKLVHGSLLYLTQSDQLRNPDNRIVLSAPSEHGLLSEYADSLQGISPADFPRFGRLFWEVRLTPEWQFWQSSPDETNPYHGRSRVLWWNPAFEEAVAAGAAYVRGQHGWGKQGVAVGQMRGLPSTIYTGEKFDTNVAVIVPREESLVPALWAFCSSPEFSTAVRRIDSALKVTNASLVKVPFDVDRWQKVAEEAGPLPKPYSNDPTQWLFKGNPTDSTEPLQVAVARLLGHYWPQQETDGLSTLAEQDGILPLSPVPGQEPAAERLRAVLAKAYGVAWSPVLQEQLLQQVSFGGKGLDVWLCDGFFEQHCRLFRRRPFIWHIWDGRRDGFSALVNYHKLDAAHLDKLIYTYIGDWIRTQRAVREAGAPGADARLVAGLELQKKLEAIRDGEPPHDIYVRWKAVEKQPIGWEPDLNDGVRLNIRPFVLAGVLRNRVNVRWSKDRGRNPDGSERINERHLTVAEKLVARHAVGV